ncbi:MAG TPA: RDD family protein [Leucothrix mucor]|uniref:RDD family protein n=1 Tax=Leucothrix mucor TaxID=45248 RepID=A0A7V2WVB8_LEUMU|nr:RDD family protein [Leucothrix mucor]
MSNSAVPASLLKRLGAMFYDFLLFGSTILVVGFISMFVITSLTGIENVARGSLFAKLFFIYLLAFGYLFFAWFWVHGGQTLGMRAWKLEVISLDGQPINWIQALFRYIYSLISWIPLGAGYLWMLFDKNKLTFHDRISKTAIIYKR